MSIGWVQSRKKFCLAYGLTGTFNFGKMGQISRVADPADRAADRRTALIIFAQSALYAALLTLLVVALPLSQLTTFSERVISLPFGSYL